MQDVLAATLHTLVTWISSKLGQEHELPGGAAVHERFIGDIRPSPPARPVLEREDGRGRPAFHDVAFCCSYFGILFRSIQQGAESEVAHGRIVGFQEPAYYALVQAFRMIKHLSFLP
jgi:hypothetical protein